MLYSQSFACYWAGRYTNGSVRADFSFDRGMALYALSYIYRLNDGEYLNAWALGVIEHWGRRYFPFAVQLAYQSWWAIHMQEHITFCAM